MISAIDSRISVSLQTCGVFLQGIQKSRHGWQHFRLIDAHTVMENLSDWLCHSNMNI